MFNLNCTIMKIEFTQMRKAFEAHSEKVCNYYFKVYFRIYNEDRTKFQRAYFYQMFDYVDAWDWVGEDAETYTMTDVKDMALECAFGTVESLKNYDYKDVVRFCNQTIERYGYRDDKRIEYKLQTA